MPSPARHPSSHERSPDRSAPAAGPRRSSWRRHRGRVAALLLVFTTAVRVLAAPLAGDGAEDGDDGAPAPASAGDRLFTEEVLPILEAHCFECHGTDAKRVKGGLLMDGHDALLLGGDTGPAVVPGDPTASALVRYVRWEEPTMEMPPRDQLPDASIAVLERWVAAGAPWPGGVELDDELLAGEDGPPRDETHEAGGRDAGAHDPVADIELPEPDAETLRWFEDEVRPLLAEHCYECHGPRAERIKGGLRMTHTAGLLRGGESGPVLDLAEPDRSLLVQALRYEGGLEMPPRGKLPEREVAVLVDWVRRGAPMPPPPEDLAHAEEEPTIDLAAGRQWWAYRPVVRPSPPGDGHPVDAFVGARLAEAGLDAAPRADERTLVRRLHLDLHGLPPTLEEVDAYVADTAPDKWERLVDRLLDSPRYGERWGRMWLDVVRFAQTNGYEKDYEKPMAWRYRDWVIQAFNDDMPYDRFLREQLAGDELDEVTEQQLVATGFYQLGVWDSEPDDWLQARYDGYDDVLRVIGEGMMGMTVGCARCHDHKFDPVRQTDYYGLLAFVENVRPYALARYSPQSATLTPLDLDEESRRRWEAGRAARLEAIAEEREALLRQARLEWLEARLDELPDTVREALDTPAGERTPEQRTTLGKLHARAPDRQTLRQNLDFQRKRQLFMLDDEEERLASSYEGEVDWALTVKEFGKSPEPTHLHVRGEAASPGAEVAPGFVPVLCADDADAEPGAPRTWFKQRSSGRRRQLAEWIASREHPTTARVLVNRLWQGHFGRGLVATPNDFGAAGSPPTHPALLDWLAAELVDHGWSMKHLHRVILGSEAYRRATTGGDPRAAEVDPANELLGTQNLQRLQAEVVRDAVLAVSGDLDLEMGGRGFYPRLSREALSGNATAGDGWGLSDEQQRHRRSVYMYAKRGVPVPLLTVLDAANPSLPVGRRDSTTVASQSLTLLNSEFMNDQARALARRVEAAVAAAGSDGTGDGTAEGELDPQVRRRALAEQAFVYALARRPDEAELDIALQHLDAQAWAFAGVTDPLRVRARVPDRVEVRYLALLGGEDVLYLPGSEWTALKGAWGNPYNKTREPDPARGPVALLREPLFADGVLSGRMRLTAGCRYGAVQLRAQPEGELTSGLELVVDPAAQELRLVELGPPAADPPAADPEVEPPLRVLARVDAPVEPDVWSAFELRAEGGRLSVRWRDLVTLDAEVTVRRPGHLGLRSWGESLELADLELALPGTDPRPLWPDDPGTPDQRALESLCLALLNTNEFLTVE